MANDVSIKFAVEGEKQLKSALSAVNEQVKALSGKFDSAVKSMADAEDKEQALKDAYDAGSEAIKAQKAQIETLTTKLDSQKKKYEELGQALNDAISKGNQDDINKLTIAFNNQATQVYKTEQQLNKANDAYAKTNTELSNMPKTVQELDESLEDAGDSASLFGDILSAEVVSDFVINGFKEIASSIKEVATASAEYADDILTLSSTTGLATDTIQEFKYMEDLVDVSFDTLTGSLTKLTKNMQTATKGTGDAYTAFEALGISVTDSSGQLRDNEEVFYEVIDALGKMDNETQRDAYAMSIFGKSAQDLNPMIEAGSERLSELAEEAHEVGYVMGEEALASNGAYQDSLDRMTKSFEGLKNTLGTNLAPVLTEVVDLINQAVNWLSEHNEVVNTAISVVTGLATAFATYKAVMLGMEIIDKVKKATEGMTLAQTLLNAVMNANPIVLIVSLLAGLVSALVLAYTTNDEFREKVNNAFQKVKEVAVNVIEKIKETILSIKELPAKALQWGKDMIQNFIDGIKAKIQNLKNAVSNIAQTVKDFLGFSEPSKGPLSNFHTYAPDMMQLYAKGMTDNIGLIEDASNKVASSVGLDGTGVAGSGSGFGGNIVVQSVLDGRIIGESVYNYTNQRKMMYGV